MSTVTTDINAPKLFLGTAGATGADPILVLEDTIGTTVVSRGGTTTTVFEDTVAQEDSTVQLRDDKQLIVYNAGEQPIFQSLTPDIADIDSNGIITAITDGIGKFKVVVGDSTYIVNVNLNSYREASVLTKLELCKGSFFYHCDKQVKDRLAGMTKGPNGYFYTSQNHTTDEFVRSPDCWVTRTDGPLPALDATCISPSNSAYGKYRAGTLITPQHIANATHYPLYVGQKVYFVTQDGLNTTVERTIVGAASMDNIYLDIRVYTMDSPVPSTITHAKVIPDYFRDIMSSTVGLPRPAVLCLDQEEKALVNNIWQLGRHSMNFKPPVDEPASLFYEKIISGDSGNPAFLVYEDELIVLMFWTFPNAGSNLAEWVPEINSLLETTDIAGLGSPTGYTLDVLDLSMWPNWTTDGSWHGTERSGLLPTWEVPQQGIQRTAAPTT